MHLRCQIIWTLIFILISPLWVIGGENPPPPQSTMHFDDDASFLLEPGTVLDLKSTQQFALSANPSIRAAAARVKSARDRLEQASSSYWPRVDSEFSYSQIDLSDNAHAAALQTAKAFNPLATIDDPENYFKVGLSATWTLFDGFERKFSITAAEYGVQESIEGLRESNRLLLAAIAEIYYNGLLSRENIAVAQANKDYYASLLSEAKARRQVGVGSLSTVLNIEVQYNSAERQLINARYDYQTSLAVLGALMGLPNALPDTIQLAPLEEEKDADFHSPDAEELLRYALENRPDILQMSCRIGLAESQQMQAKAQFYPRLDLRATYSGERTDNMSFDQDDFGNTIMLNLSYNLFAGGLYKKKISEARHLINAADKEYDNLKNSIGREIRAAVLALRFAQDQIELQRSNLQLVRQNRDLVEKEYEVGQALLIRLNEAQRDLITTQSVLAQARVSLRRAWHNLEIASGRGLERRDL
ncbi:TolC family protein [Thermodesulfobacteriota bacterium]